MSASSPPPWERGRWSSIHRWGVQNPKWYYITPASVWAVLIYVASIANLKPATDIDWLSSIFTFDKLAHFGLYMILAMLIIRGWHREKMPPIGLHALVLTLCFVFGAMIEVHQSLLSYRSFEVGDILADLLGSLTGLIIWHLMMVRWGKRTRLYPGLFRPDPKQEN